MLYCNYNRYLMYKLVLLRHGESVWNKKGLFTGWTDVSLTARGERESRAAGRELRRRGFIFDLVFVSFLKRTSQTLKWVLDGLKISKMLIRKDWPLNERHYGNLQGLNKVSLAKKFGLAQIFLWRRGYSIKPPPIITDNPYDQRDDIKYQGIHVPDRESLKDVVARVVPFWRQTIAPEIKKGRRILIVASGNSLRALIKYLDKIPAQEIVKLDIPFTIPLVYELDNKLKPIRHYYLADKKKLAKEIARVRRLGIIKV